MPELPEVETVARTLREGRGAPTLIGRTIQQAHILWPREIGNMPPAVFARRVTGLRVERIGRHGKYLLIGLSGADESLTAPTMLVHLKMSGKLDVVPAADAFTKHARVVWQLDDGLALRFEDARKFGRVWLADDIATITGKLGPDALDITEDDFAARLLQKKRALKPLLLDQTFVAGVGNIYADESLHRSKLHPQRLSNTLTEADARRLFVAVRAVLDQGILANGASFDWVYPGGNFQSNFMVYGMTDKPCPTCGDPIRRILVGQRSTHFCPTCQPLP